ncbi:MAG: flagellin, partial [Clostridium sp.]|uniref:flagellin N-terminal helical domain-containing protein n=1 Tax=Clostridium sp. TaxID=1506 RepID=UPI003A9D55BD
MIINHNLNAMNAHRNMGINNTNSAKAMEKLSSGLRINRAGDDAAGLAISE